MKKAALIMVSLFICSLVQAQEGSMPNWANKTGAFGVGISTTLGGSNRMNKNITDEESYSYNAFGVNLRYNPVPLVNLDLTLGTSSEKYDNHTEYDTGFGDEEVDNGYVFKGFNANIKVLFPLFGTNGVLTPSCNSGLVFSPYVGLNFQRGTDMWYYESRFVDEEEEEAFTKSYYNIGTRLEYFAPPIGGLNGSVFFNTRILSYNCLNYKDPDVDDSSTFTFFQGAESFGVFGLSVWF